MEAVGYAAEDVEGQGYKKIVYGSCHGQRLEKHAINFPCEEIALPLALALSLTLEPCPLGLREGFLTTARVTPTLFFLNPFL